MIEPIATRRSWLGETLTLLRACWWRVLAISAVTEVVAVLAVGALLLSYYGGPGREHELDDPARMVLIFGLPAVLSAACSAWSWAAVVEVLRGAGEGRQVRVGAALRHGVRHSGRLTLWLAAIGLVRAGGGVYLLYQLLERRVPISAYETAADVVSAGGWYLSFATALLPLVVLLERRGAVRAWWLAHSRAATIAQIVAVLAVGFAVDELVDLALDESLGAGDLPRVPLLVVEAVLGSIIGVLVSAVTSTALTVAYLRRVDLPAMPDPSATPDPTAAGAVQGPPEPVVIELGRTW